MSVQPTPVPPPPSRTLLQRAPDLLLWGGVFVLLAIAFGPAEIRKIPLLFSNSANMQEMGRGFTQPDFTDWRLYVSQMWLTVQIAIWGTSLAVLMAIPLGLLASRNITPAFIQVPVRRFLDIVRSAPTGGCDGKSAGCTASLPIASSASSPASLASPLKLPPQPRVHKVARTSTVQRRIGHLQRPGNRGGAARNGHRDSGGVLGQTVNAPVSLARRGSRVVDRVGVGST
jgi:ABC-type amino acid transport system permease subunit